MATLNLGRIKPVFRGAYAGGTAYVIDDIVTSGGETFICIQASTGNATSSASHWTKLAEKGTNGTDGTNVATTITTQGDILYRDGSGLARLPAGTSGQVLKTGGSGANPSWGTVSSDFVKIASGSVSGSASTLSIDGYYSSDYKNYRMYFQNIQNNNTNTALRFNFGGSAYTSGNYRGALVGVQNNNGNMSTAQVNVVWNSGEINIANWGATNGYGDIVILDIIEPQSTTYYKRVLWHTATFNGSEVHDLTGMAHLQANQSTASTGLTWKSGNGNNMTTGDWYLYGIKG